MCWRVDWEIRTNVSETCHLHHLLMMKTSHFYDTSTDCTPSHPKKLRSFFSPSRESKIWRSLTYNLPAKWSSFKILNQIHKHSLTLCFVGQTWHRLHHTVRLLTPKMCTGYTLKQHWPNVTSEVRKAVRILVYCTAYCGWPPDFRWNASIFLHPEDGDGVFLPILICKTTWYHNPDN